MIKIISVNSTGSNISVSWENSFSSIESLHIVFDDEGSCTSIGLEKSDLQFSTNKLSRYRTYEIYLKALTKDGWKTSDPYTYRLA